MRILLINPNGDQTMAAKIQKSARQFAHGRFEADCLCAEGAPHFIETYLDMHLAAQGMVRLLRDNQERYDAFVVACGYDPNLDLLKELTEKPVVGTAEASMKLASMLGHRFSVLCTHAHSVPIKEDLALRCGVERQVASFRVAALPGAEGAGDEAPAELLQAYGAVCRRAVEEDGAEAVVLGCAGFSGLGRQLTALAGIPVLEGVTCGLMVAEGLVRSGLSISKARRYAGG